MIKLLTFISHTNARNVFCSQSKYSAHSRSPTLSMPSGWCPPLIQHIMWSLRLSCGNLLRLLNEMKKSCDRMVLLGSAAVPLPKDNFVLIYSWRAERNVGRASYCSTVLGSLTRLTSFSLYDRYSLQVIQLGPHFSLVYRRSYICNFSAYAL